MLYIYSLFFNYLYCSHNKNIKNNNKDENKQINQNIKNNTNNIKNNTNNIKNNTNNIKNNTNIINESQKKNPGNKNKSVVTNKSNTINNVHLENASHINKKIPTVVKKNVKNNEISVGKLMNDFNKKINNLIGVVDNICDILPDITDKLKNIEDLLDSQEIVIQDLKLKIFKIQEEIHNMKAQSQKHEENLLDMVQKLAQETIQTTQFDNLIINYRTLKQRIDDMFPMDKKAIVDMRKTIYHIKRQLNILQKRGQIKSFDGNVFGLRSENNNYLPVIQKKVVVSDTILKTDKDIDNKDVAKINKKNKNHSMNKKKDCKTNENNQQKKIFNDKLNNIRTLKNNLTTTKLIIKS